MSSSEVVVAFQGASLAQRHAHLLKGAAYDIDPSTELVPAAELPGLIAEFERSLQPASRENVSKAVAVLFGSFKIGNVVDDAQAFTKAMIAELAEFPADVLQDAVRQARRTLKWLPSIAEMLEICAQVGSPCRGQLQRAKQMQAEYRRREEHEAKRAERQRRNAAYRGEMSAAAEAELGARGLSLAQIEDELIVFRMYPDDGPAMFKVLELARDWEARKNTAAASPA